ncbi:hypothetical protein LJC49_00435 [Ruminococcaceae bacterium OttesenSCG-928-I18]|nr:hypothetical protein [Ruminococcaceae bacterium OttesenSCG-928-I18]
MGKLLRNTVLLLVPILLYYGLFLAFEPNNYFGLRAKTPTGAIFGELREYRENPTTGVLIGDSRFANIADMRTINEVTGREFSNLAFGGASLKENLDELDYLLERYPQIEEVVFELSFYTLNANYAADRFGFIELALYNPFAYMTNLSYNLEAMQNLVLWLDGQTLGGGENETRNPVQDRYIQWNPLPGGQEVTIRQDIAKYIEAISVYTENWRLDTGEGNSFDRLLETIEACEEKGIRFTVVLPPIHDAVMEYAVRQNGIYEQMLPLVQQLNESPARVLDYEMTERPVYDEEAWFDGFHLDYKHGLSQWTRQLAEDLK